MSGEHKEARYIEGHGKSGPGKSGDYVQFWVIIVHNLDNIVSYHVVSRFSTRQFLAASTRLGKGAVIRRCHTSTFTPEVKEDEPDVP